MYQNILVINLMHLGDLMLVTPVLRTLRSSYPKARISLLADEKLADIVQENRHIDACLLIDKKGRDNGILGILRFALRLRRNRYDLVINLHRNERSSALAALSGGRRIVGYTKPGFSLFFDHVSPDQNPIMHEVHSHYAALRSAGVIGEVDDAGLEMWLPPAAEAEAERLWAEHFRPEDKVIALNIGASWLTKRWMDDYFAVVADIYLARGYHIAVMGGPMDAEIVAGQPAPAHFHGAGQPRRACGPPAALHSLHHDGFGAHARRRGDERADHLHVRRLSDSGILPLRCEEHLCPRPCSVPSLPHSRVSAAGCRAHEVHEAHAAGSHFEICRSDARRIRRASGL